MTFVQQFVQTIASLGIAFLLAFPLGYERKSHGATGVGLRTVPLVAIGACAYLLMARYLYEQGLFDTNGLGRTLRALMSGLGFVGGGAILKHTSKVKGVAGLATGASVWTAGAIGAAVAHGYIQIALMVSVVSLIAADLTYRLSGGHERIDDGEERAQAREGDENVAADRQRGSRY